MGAVYIRFSLCFLHDFSFFRWFDRPLDNFVLPNLCAYYSPACRSADLHPHCGELVPLRHGFPSGSDVPPQAPLGAPPQHPAHPRAARPQKVSLPLPMLSPLLLCLRRRNPDLPLSCIFFNSLQTLRRLLLSGRQFLVLVDDGEFRGRNVQ